MPISTINTSSHWVRSAQVNNLVISNESPSTDFAQVFDFASKNLEADGNNLFIKKDAEVMSDVDFQNENISQSLEAFAENLQSLFQSFQIQAENDLSKKQSKAIEEQAIYMQKALRMMGSRLDNQDHPAVIKTEYQAVGNRHRKNDSLHLDGR